MYLQFFSLKTDDRIENAILSLQEVFYLSQFCSVHINIPYRDNWYNVPEAPGFSAYDLKIAYISYTSITEATINGLSFPRFAMNLRTMVTESCLIRFKSLISSLLSDAKASIMMS